MKRIKKIGIYKIENLINGKVYIGQSKDIDKRVKHHFVDSAFNEKNVEYNTPVHQAIRKYGVENFKVEVLEQCLREELDAREVYWIDKYESFPPDAGKGYNLTAGAKSATAIHFLYPKLDQITDDLKHSMLSHQQIADKYETSREMIQGINTGRYWYRDKMQYPVRDFYIRYPRSTDKNPEVRKVYYSRDGAEKSPRYTHICRVCGNRMTTSALICSKCYNDSRAKTLPDDFLDVVIHLKAKLHIQNHYKVGPNTLNRWLSEANIDLDKIKYPNRKEKKIKQQIGCFEYLSDDEPVAIFPSFKAASDSIGVRAPAMIKKACLEGTDYHGYYWKFI